MGVLESRTRIFAGAVAISTQFELSPLYVDFRHWWMFMPTSLTSPARASE